jgi:hypothetical protein
MTLKFSFKIDQYCCFDMDVILIYNKEVKSILILSIFYSTLVSGSQWSDEVWTAQKLKIKFKYNKDLSLRINEECFNNYNRCEALRATRYAQIKKFDSEGGKSPYSQVCSESTKGKVIFLSNDKGNSSSFCLFKDKSMIDNASLYSKVKK